MYGTGEDELIPAKWSASSDEGQEYHEHPQTHLQVEKSLTDQLGTLFLYTIQTFTHWAGQFMRRQLVQLLQPCHAHVVRITTLVHAFQFCPVLTMSEKHMGAVIIGATPLQATWYSGFRPCMMA